MRLNTVLLLILLPCAAAFFSVFNGDIMMDDRAIELRGISWYGAEMNNLVVEGLWAYPIDHYLDLLTSLSFNALRLPFSVDMMYYHNNTIPGMDLISADPSIAGLTSLEIMDVIFQKCQKRGIVVLLDCHRVSMRSPSPSWTIPGNHYFTEDVFVETWIQVYQHFSVYPNLIGFEIYNEPHNGTPMRDFISIILRLLEKIPDVLFFIDGVEWGHDFRDLRYDNPLLSYASRIIYGPHIYGPTLTPLMQYTESYVQYLYDQFFGFLKTEADASICITEWGYNENNANDATWAELFAEYLIHRNITNQFFWSLNPNGKDIKGILQPDWLTLSQSKMDLVRRVSPSPTFFFF